MEAFHATVRNPSTESFMYFKNQTIRGIYSAYIRQKVLESTPDGYESLRASMLKHVAIGLEGFRMDTGYVTSMDGLCATTSLVPDSGEEAMEIGKIQKMTCHSCGREGHMERRCPKRSCFTCGREGHWAAECTRKHRDQPGAERKYLSHINKDLHTGYRTSTTKDRTTSSKVGTAIPSTSTGYSHQHPRSEEKCGFCDKRGHATSDCRKKRKYRFRKVNKRGKVKGVG